MSEVILIGGGARSGKSRLGLQMALDRGGTRAFIATAQAFDDEMRARIDRHRAERGQAFLTVEAPLELERALLTLAERSEPVGVTLVDCLTLWLSNLLLLEESEERVQARVESLCQVLPSLPFATILITNEVGQGIVPQSALGRTFRDVTGRAHQALSEVASEVRVAMFGHSLRLKPAPLSVEPLPPLSR